MGRQAAILGIKLKLQEQQLDRVKKLMEQGAISAEQFDEMKALVAKSALDLKQLQEQLDRAKDPLPKTERVACGTGLQSAIWKSDECRQWLRLNARACRWNGHQRQSPSCFQELVGSPAAVADRS